MDPQIAREEWLALFGHDPRVSAAYLRERDGQIGIGTGKGGLRMAKAARKKKSTKSESVEIGIIGGSGLYHMSGLTDTREVRVKTPFGDPPTPS